VPLRRRCRSTAATKQDLDEVVFENRTCEAQIAALKDALGDMRGRGFDLSTASRALVVKERGGLVNLDSGISGFSA
jgi:hypothetical protein